jgi:hypothetical protein
MNEEIIEARKSLVADGLLRDSGKTRNGHVIWERVPVDELTPEALAHWNQLYGMTSPERTN